MHKSLRMVAATALVLSPVIATSASAAARNIVLVHGMGNDGSVWRPVYEILKAKGYEVSIVQQPLNGFEEDVKATQRAIARQSGPVVLVAHSYGGVVITTAGNDPKVKALVYVAALQPDKGDTMAGLNAKMPAAFDTKSVQASPDGYITVTHDAYVRDVAEDLPAATADFLAASQAPTTAAVFTAATVDPAWRHKPSFGIVAVQDRTINPDLERWMYKRSDTKVTEIKSGHMVQIGHPQEVADVIIKAAQSVD
jgi:pimeloyl-ACP methyl ester carboxylesterase